MLLYSPVHSACDEFVGGRNVVLVAYTGAQVDFFVFETSSTRTTMDFLGVVVP